MNVNVVFQFDMLHIVGCRPSQEERLFLGKVAYKEERTAGRKINTCKGSMQGVHARNT
jgi:hypothetical protein